MKIIRVKDFYNGSKCAICNLYVSLKWNQAKHLVSTHNLLLWTLGERQKMKQRVIR